MRAWLENSALKKIDREQKSLACAFVLLFGRYIGYGPELFQPRTYTLERGQFVPAKDQGVSAQALSIYKRKTAYGSTYVGTLFFTRNDRQLFEIMVEVMDPNNPHAPV